MRWKIFFVGLLICLHLSGCQQIQRPQDSFSWKQAYDHAMRNGTVRLRLVNVASTDWEAVDVLLLDGKKKFDVCSVCFYAQKPSNFLIDLSPTLRQCREPLSPQAKIVLRGKHDGVRVVCEEIKVEFPDRP